MIAAPADLLVIGALTVDRFADGSTAPGGSALHIARALAPRGVRVAVLTVAGPEREARTGLAELRRLAVAVEAAAAPATATFGHREAADGRRLGLERRGGRVLVNASLLPSARAVLVAPIAGEIDVGALSRLEAALVRGAILQGWLRSLDEHREVRPLPLSVLRPPLVAALSGFDLLVASREDLAAEPGDPPAQLAALRRTFGGRPALVVTGEVDGAWIDEHGVGLRHLPVPWRVAGAPTVGAGDILAALLTIALADPAVDVEDSIRAAMETVAEVLEGRRG